MVMISAEDARLYMECQLKHAGAVNAYVAARETAIQANEGPPAAK